MKPDEYQKALNAAHEEIQDILQQKFVLDDRLSQLKRTVDALSSLVEEFPPVAQLYGAVAEGLPVGGISNAIRRILTESKSPMTPTQIKTALSARGFDMSEYANAAAVIHNTLKRLERQKELTVVQSPAGNIAYAIYRSLTPLDADSGPKQK
jgi:hypothetical protein